MEKAKEKTNSMLLASITLNKPVLQENSKVLLALDNKSQYAEMLERRVEIHDFLRQELQNGNLEVLLEVRKGMKNKKAYTQEEKFRAMVEKNPALLELQKKLDLDLL